MPIPQLLRRAEQLDLMIEVLYDTIDTEHDQALVDRLTDHAADRVLDYHAIRCELMLAESDAV